MTFWISAGKSWSGGERMFLVVLVVLRDSHRSSAALGYRHKNAEKRLVLGTTLGVWCTGQISKMRFPDITGYVPWYLGCDWNDPSGAFWRSKTVDDSKYLSGIGETYENTRTSWFSLHFGASNEKSTYRGDIDTVQPQSLRMLPCIKSWHHRIDWHRCSLSCVLGFFGVFFFIKRRRLWTYVGTK